MKKIKVALFNNVNYCKYPDNIENIKDFIDTLNKNYNSFIELEILVEEGCVAPYFIEENLKTETQYWNPSHIRLVKDTEITVLSNTEYREKLEKVINEKCVHCIHYNEEGCDEDLKTFIEKIDLDGECYSFEKKD